jgi:hypothetical protein
MRFGREGTNAHLAPEVLALYTRGDLPLLTGWRVRRHLHQCAACEREASLFSSALAELKREAAAESLTAFEAVANWSSLEREMLGNIVVGVSAARCIENVGRKKHHLSKIAIATGLSALFAAGWFSHIPREETRHLAATIATLAGGRRPLRLTNVVQTTPTGIAVRSEGVTLTILHPPGAVVSVSGTAAVEARYVDEDTGQLTIAGVYGQ